MQNHCGEMVIQVTGLVDVNWPYISTEEAGF